MDTEKTGSKDDEALPRDLLAAGRRAAERRLADHDLEAGLASVLAALEARRGAGAPGDGGLRGASRWLNAKMIFGIGAALVLAGGATAGVHLRSPPAPIPASHLESEAPPILPRAAPEPPASADLPGSPPATIPSVEPTAPPPAPRATVAPRPAASTDDEAEHLKRLRRLVSENAAAALTMAEADNITFARGNLGGAREALAVQALLKLGRSAEARARARTFLQTHGESPLSDYFHTVAEPATGGEAP